MPRYFFHVHDGASFPDLEGTELPDLAAARREAVLSSAQLLTDNPDQFWDGEAWSMQVTDESGATLFVLQFAAMAHA
jgi:hypothetical protein